VDVDKRRGGGVGEGAGSDLGGGGGLGGGPLFACHLAAGGGVSWKGRNPKKGSGGVGGGGGQGDQEFCSRFVQERFVESRAFGAFGANPLNSFKGDSLPEPVVERFKLVGRYGDTRASRRWRDLR